MDTDCRKTPMNLAACSIGQGRDLTGPVMCLWELNSICCWATRITRKALYRRGAAEAVYTVPLLPSPLIQP